jgi:putative DNA primase/helicase
MEGDKLAIRQFIERVHGPEPEGWLVVWTRQDKASRAFPLAQEGALDAAVAYCAERAARMDVYAAVGLQREEPEHGSRGKEAGVVSALGVWADIDIGGAAHKAKDLPASEEEALSLVEAVGLPPSVIVRSGFGLQVYWLFREPFVIETEAERQELKSLSRRFQQMLRLQALARGWTIDPTADLCRVLRVPGTFNRKLPDDVRPVTAEYFDRAYCVDDIGEILCGLDDPGEPALSQPPPDLPPAKLPPVLDGCAWMRHCRDDAATLPEPEWYRMLTVIARCEDAERWAHELSRAHPKYSRRETQRKLKQASGEKMAPVTCAYVESDLGGARFCDACLFRGNVNSPIAIGRMEDESAPPKPQAEPDAEQSSEAPEEQSAPAPAPVEAASRIEKYTDLGNARRFVARYRNTVLYCEPWGRWLLWDSMRWAEDERLEVFARATDLIRSLYSLAKKIKDEDERKAFLTHLIKSESHRALNAMVTLAKSDRTVARHPDDFDSDPWLFTVKNGTLDLRTGRLRPHSQTDLITKLAPVVHDPSARCPNWLAFLDMIMLGRQSLVDFLKRALGSSLTGITSDKAMFILYGPGGDNGKSTMVEVMEMLLGNYARRTPVETFLKRREGAIPNDIARLRGARFVWAAENDRGVRLAESLIKEMTGGDRMVARFLHGEFFEFMPAFKIWFATNHKPTIRGDAAIWRRLKLVPFDYTIPKDKQKRRHEVMAMFQAELSGILNWALDGCMEWQRDGLGVPDEVITATREYEAEQDTFSMFLDEKCVKVPNARALSLALYREYKTWAEQYGESPVSHKTFASLMSERGFSKTKTMKGALYSGIGLRTEDHYDTPRTAQTVPRQSSFNRDEDGEEV